MNSNPMLHKILQTIPIFLRRDSAKTTCFEDLQWDNKITLSPFFVLGDNNQISKPPCTQVKISQDCPILMPIREPQIQVATVANTTHPQGTDAHQFQPSVN